MFNILYDFDLLLVMLWKKKQQN